MAKFLAFLPSTMFVVKTFDLFCSIIKSTILSDFSRKFSSVARLDFSYSVRLRDQKRLIVKVYFPLITLVTFVI